MNTTLSTKFAALALALMANGVLMGSVAYLFSTQANQTTVAIAVRASKPTPPTARFERQPNKSLKVD